MAKSSQYYLGSLDGLRLVSFLIIFVHHLPEPAAIEIFSERGWASVDLFFVISAFLLFRLLEAEYRKDGQISIRNFYIRRVLRIYPLLVVYYTAVFIIGGGVSDMKAWLRFAATLASVDNVAIWWWNYNYSVNAVGHLWTLSFEVQIYLLLPAAFFAWLKWGTRRFLWCLVAIELVAFVARFWAIESGIEYPSIYVHPYLRPESILLGLGLAVVKPQWNPLWSVLAFFGAGFAFLAMSPANVLFIYFPIAIMVVALVDAGLRFRPLRALLSLRLRRYLGTISYGLYVFHIAVIYATVDILSLPGLEGLSNGPVLFALSLTLTIAAASVSYRFLERPFLQLKRRYTSIDGRASASREGTQESPSGGASRGTDVARSDQ